jgi:protein SCO1/2
MKKRTFLKITAGVILAMPDSVFSLVNAADKLNLETVTSPEYHGKHLINVPVMTHEGKGVLFYDDLIKGKTVLINFMYTRCPHNCVATMENLRNVYQELGGRIGRDVFMYSVTLEPEYDTPELLKSYVKRSKVGPGWIFLTGTKENIEQLRANLDFKNSDPVIDRDKTQHIGVVKFGIEPLKRWGMAPVMSSPTAIADYVNWPKSGVELSSLATLPDSFINPGNNRTRGA